MRRASRASALLPLLLCCAALIPAGAALAADAIEVGPATTPEPGGELGRISDERTRTHWAYAQRRAEIRSAPNVSAPSVARVRLTTELNRPEAYLVLSRRFDEAGDPWLEVRIPMRPNGRTGWVSEDALGALHITRTQLVISLGKRRATLFEKGRARWSAPVGIGRGGTPTPRGRFYVRERLALGRSGGPYGAFAFGTSAYSPTLSDWPGGGVIGIHGTDQPELIPGRVSHGCVRLRNRDVLRLRKLMGVGTPVWVK